MRLLGLRRQMVRSRRTRIGLTLAGVAVPVVLALAVWAGADPRRRPAPGLDGARPVRRASPLVAVLAPLAVGGAYQLFPDEHLVAYPVRPATVAVRLPAAEPAEPHLAGPGGRRGHRHRVPGRARPPARTGRADRGRLRGSGRASPGRALAWAGRRSAGPPGRTGRDPRPHGGPRRRAPGSSPPPGTGEPVLDALPSGWAITLVEQAYAGSAARWATGFAVLVLGAVVAAGATVRACGWALTRSSAPTAGAAPAGPPARATVVGVPGAGRDRPGQRLARPGAAAGHPAARDRAGRDRRGGRPALVRRSSCCRASWRPGTGLLFGINVFCLDAGGATWLATLPQDPRTAYLAKARVLAETCLLTSVSTVLVAASRTPGAPNAAELAAVAGAVVLGPGAGGRGLHVHLGPPPAPGGAARAAGHPGPARVDVRQHRRCSPWPPRSPAPCCPPPAYEPDRPWLPLALAVGHGTCPPSPRCCAARTGGASPPAGPAWSRPSPPADPSRPADQVVRRRGPACGSADRAMGDRDDPDKSREPSRANPSPFPKRFGHGRPERRNPPGVILFRRIVVLRPRPRAEGASGLEDTLRDVLVVSRNAAIAAALTADDLNVIPIDPDETPGWPSFASAAHLLVLELGDPDYMVDVVKTLRRDDVDVAVLIIAESVSDSPRLIALRLTDDDVKTLSLPITQNRLLRAVSRALLAREAADARLEEAYQALAAGDDDDSWMPSVAGVDWGTSSEISEPVIASEPSAPSARRIEPAVPAAEPTAPAFEPPVPPPPAVFVPPGLPISEPPAASPGRRRPPRLPPGTRGSRSGACADCRAGPADRRELAAHRLQRLDVRVQLGQPRRPPPAWTPRRRRSRAGPPPSRSRAPRPRLPPAPAAGRRAEHAAGAHPPVLPPPPLVPPVIPPVYEARGRPRLAPAGAEPRRPGPADRADVAAGRPVRRAADPGLVRGRLLHVRAGPGRASSRSPFTRSRTTGAAGSAPRSSRRWTWTRSARRPRRRPTPRAPTPRRPTGPRRPRWPSTPRTPATAAPRSRPAPAADPRSAPPAEPTARADRPTAPTDDYDLPPGPDGQPSKRRLAPWARPRRARRRRPTR